MDLLCGTGNSRCWPMFYCRRHIRQPWKRLHRLCRRASRGRTPSIRCARQDAEWAKLHFNTGPSTYVKDENGSSAPGLLRENSLSSCRCSATGGIDIPGRLFLDVQSVHELCGHLPTTVPRVSARSRVLPCSDTTKLKLHAGRPKIRDQHRPRLIPLVRLSIDLMRPYVGEPSGARRQFHAERLSDRRHGCHSERGEYP